MIAHTRISRLNLNLQHFYKKQSYEKAMLLFLLLLVVACKKESESAGVNIGEIGTNNTAYENVNIADYQVEELPGTNWQKATKVDTAGNPLETGYFENGKKVGSWLLYEHQKMQFPSKLSTYKDGKLNGLHMQMNQGGQLELIAYYQNNNLHGPWGRYRFARLVEELNYKNGKVDGVFNIYAVNNGKLQTSAEYKNGVQDGFYRTYNPMGEITSEYQYKEGKQVGGGAIYKK